MSYTKTNWQTGDVITAPKLNNIENGIAGLNGDMPETLIVRLTKSGNVYSSDKTYSELVSAMTEGKLILVFDDKGNVYTNPQIWQDIYVADGDIIKFTSIWWNDSENGLTISIFSFYQRNNEDVVSYAYVRHQ